MSAQTPQSPFSTEQRVRFTALAASRNLSHIRWREESPLGVTNPASVGLQLVTSLLLWVATAPLEQVLNDLDDDPLTPKLRRLWAGMDFDPGNPAGLRVTLPKWRQAIARGQVEPILNKNGWDVEGVRAWLGGPRGIGVVWEMTLDRARLEVIVDGLAAALPYWGTPLTPLLQKEPKAGAVHRDRQHKGRRERSAEPRD